MSAKVFHRDRLPPLMQRFADAWQREGTFDLTVPEGGGDRDDALQLVDFAKGRRQLDDGTWVITNLAKVVTFARTAIDSAHGHRAAGDLHPVRTTFATNGLPATVYMGDEEDPIVRTEALRLFQLLGEFAEAHGFEWGGRFPHYDGPHVQVPHWRTLPLVS